MKSPILSSCVALLLTSIGHSLPVVNGSFEDGNTGFSSDYSFAITNSTEGQYTVRSDPQNWNGAFSNFGDHTPGTGTMMMVVNGATSGSNAVWRQTFTVAAGTSYDFSAWAGTAVSGGPASLLLRVDGSFVGPAFTLPVASGTWVPWATSWTALAGGLSTVEIVNSNLSVYPNDFYVDDIAITDRPPGAAVSEGSATGSLLAVPLLLSLLIRFRRSRESVAVA